MKRAITAVPQPQYQQEQVAAELDEARQQLVDAEAKLAQEQAAVNAFRMQCRLKLGDLIEETLALRAERESCLTQLKLHQQDAELPSDTPDPFAPEEETAVHEAVEFDEIALPELATPQQEKEAAKRLYRELARRFHPDLAAGSAERAYMTAIMSAVNVAYEQQDMAALHNLAGELDGTAVAELAAIQNLQIRQQREQLLKIQRRQRKVQQQYRALRQDNVAKLWRKAQHLEAEGKSWWEAVKRDLQRIIQRTRVDLLDLQGQLSKFEISE
ncbi:MAG: J domain-containing protein [Anaerolineales bacterium]|nr:J domain-containing protein [Anaerolineales bacterium]